MAKSAKAAAEKISALVDELIFQSAQMATLCFNLSQRSGEPITERNANIMKQLQLP